MEKSKWSWGFQCFKQVTDLVTGVGLDSLALDLLPASCLTTGRSLNFSEPQFPNVKGGGEYPPCVFADITKPDEIHICPITVSRMWGMFCKCHFFFCF